VLLWLSVAQDILFLNNLSRLEAMGRDELADKLRTAHWMIERFAGFAIDSDLAGMVNELQRLNASVSYL